jgi:hypothetical protein
MPNTYDEWMWWSFSVILAGLLLSIIANYIYTSLRPRFDVWLDKTSENRRLSNLQSQQEFDRRIDEMVTDPQKVLQIEMRHAVASLSYYITFLMIGLLVVITLVDSSRILYDAIALVLFALATLVSLFTREKYWSLIKGYEDRKHNPELPSSKATLDSQPQNLKLEP